VKRKSYGERIDALLDAAFSELQHDTGESNPEWHHQRANLAEKFRKVLRKHTRTATPND
jgi:hypothetical protein